MEMYRTGLWNLYTGGGQLTVLSAVSVFLTTRDPKAFAMPLDHGCRLDQHHGIEDLRPNPVKPNPEKSVRGEEPNPTWMLPTQDAYLMPQANQLELQGCAAAKPEGEDGNHSGQNRNHACDGTAVPPKSLDFSAIRSFEARSA